MSSSISASPLGSIAPAPGRSASYAQNTEKENSFLTYGGNGVRHMGKRGRVGELKTPFESGTHLQKGAVPVGGEPAVECEGVRCGSKQQRLHEREQLLSCATRIPFRRPPPRAPPPAPSATPPQCGGARPRTRALGGSCAARASSESRRSARRASEAPRGRGGAPPRIGIPTGGMGKGSV